jgi:hypothetical protein
MQQGFEVDLCWNRLGPLETDCHYEFRGGQGFWVRAQSRNHRDYNFEQQQMAFHLRLLRSVAAIR